MDPARADTFGGPFPPESVEALRKQLYRTNEVTVPTGLTGVKAKAINCRAVTASNCESACHWTQDFGSKRRRASNYSAPESLPACESCSADEAGGHNQDAAVAAARTTAMTPSDTPMGTL